MDALRLGPFTLEIPLARGGMGEVWRAVHVESGARVAIKVLAGAASPAVHAALDAEIRAVAALDHPHVVWLYDRGIVSAEAATASEGRLTEGTPWFAMEFADGGTLSQRMASLDWPSLRTLLLQLLDALAHAHAHGVVHRDIKPPNVLLRRDGDVVLSDFGIAWALEHREDHAPKVGHTAGTPSYMAPEQILEKVAAQGPWTDLYAVGCVAYQAVSGRSPFRRKDWQATLRAHLYEPLPPLAPRFPVPSGLWTWLGRMTQKDPTLRYRFAADAAHALREIQDVPPPPEEDDEISRSDADTVTLVDTGPDHEAPPLPDTWRSRAGPRPMRLSGAGLGLYGLRDVPIVGREAERDALWEALRQVWADRRLRVVRIEGPTGTGKSRLAASLAIRAHEVGGAHVLRAGHQAQVGAGDGIAGLLERDLRCRGLSRDEVVARVHEGLGAIRLGDPDDARFLVDLLRPTSDQGSSAQERAARLRRYVQARGRERPVVLWLDDLQWGAETLQVLRAWLTSGEAVPALVIGTVQSESLGPDAAAMLDGLGDRVLRIALGPVPERERAALIRELLPLEADLARQVEERTAGNPLFAVQVLGDWVQRELLVAGPGGFRLAGDAGPLPSSIVEVWGRRVVELLRGRRPADRLALEIAATLGMEVDSGEWRAACAEAGVSADPGLVGELVARRLGVADAQTDAWSFVHGMLREAILDEARRWGRLAEHHLGCADALKDRVGRDIDARRGRHLRLGGDPRAAMVCLSAATSRSRHDGDGRTADVLLKELTLAADEAGLAADDPARLRAQASGVVVSFMCGRDAEGEALYAHIRAMGAEGAILAAAALSLASGLQVRGRTEEANLRASEAYDLATASGARDTASIAASVLADTALRRGRLDEAARWFRTGLADAEASGARHGELTSWFGLAWVALERGALDDVSEPAARARALADALGSRALQARIINLDGEVARLQGRRADARRFYADAGRRLEGLGALDACYCGINQGFVACEEGAFLEADALFLTALGQAQAAGDRFGRMAAHHGLAATRAGAPDGDFDPHEHEGTAAADREGIALADLAEMAELAGRRAAEAGRADRAARLLQSAARQWRALGRGDRADRLGLASS